MLLADLSVNHVERQILLRGFAINRMERILSASLMQFRRGIISWKKDVSLAEMDAFLSPDGTRQETLSAKKR